MSITLLSPTARRIGTTAAALTIAATGIAVAPATAASGPDTTAAQEQTAENDRRAEIINRAQFWVDQGVPYSMSAYYPDINDLCLACDVGVLDYSSLRFDFALMRKPMVFLVPDKEAYHRLRPAVLAYDDTAPGPHVSSGEQVESEVRDLPALRRRYAEAVELFISTYMDLEDGHATERVVNAVFGSDAGTVPRA